MILADWKSLPTTSASVVGLTGETRARLVTDSGCCDWLSFVESVPNLSSRGTHLIESLYALSVAHWPQGIIVSRLAFDMDVPFACDMAISIQWNDADQFRVEATTNGETVVWWVNPSTRMGTDLINELKYLKRKAAPYFELPPEDVKAVQRDLRRR